MWAFHIKPTEDAASIGILRVNDIDLISLIQSISGLWEAIGLWELVKLVTTAHTQRLKDFVCPPPARLIEVWLI